MVRRATPSSPGLRACQILVVLRLSTPSRLTERRLPRRCLGGTSGDPASWSEHCLRGGAGACMAGLQTFGGASDGFAWDAAIVLRLADNAATSWRRAPGGYTTQFGVCIGLSAMPAGWSRQGVWRVVVVRYDAPVPAGVHPALDELGEPWPAETEVGVPEGVPVLVGPDFLVDGRLSRFLLTFAPSSFATARSYASTLATFFGFLDRRGQCWDSATGADVDAYRFWRLADPANPCRISAASFNRELAALGHLYRWAHARGMVAENPVRVRKAAVGEDRFADVPEGRVRRRQDVRCEVADLTGVRAVEGCRAVRLPGRRAPGPIVARPQ